MFVSPPAECPDKPLELLEREICQLAAHLAAATCRWLLLVAEFDERSGWAEWGVKSCAHWLSWRCSVTPRAAREHVRVARRLQELPRVREAFARGELSYSKVRALTRVADEETEADLVEIARHATGAQLEKLVRSYGGALSATVGAAQQAQERRFMSWEWEEDGSLRVNARLTADEGALLLAAIQSAEAEVSESPDAGQRRADALVDIAQAALAAGPGELAAHPAEVVVHVDAASLAADTVCESCEIADGPSIAPETARRLACDGAMVRIVEQDGQPLSVGRRTRAIPPALRRALRSREGGGCAYPGCDHRRFLHAHHIQHWARGGRTELSNLVQLCSYHHRLVHEGGFHVEREGESVQFRRPDGRLVRRHEPQPAARGPGLESQNATHGLEPDGDTCRPLSAGDSLDYHMAVELLIRQALGPT